MIEEVVIRMGMDARPVSAALRGVRKEFSTFKTDLKALDPMSMLTSTLGMIGIATSIGALAAGAKGLMTFAHELRTSAEALSVNTTTLQAWQIRVSKTGGDTESAEKALVKLAAKINSAAEGNKEAVTSFEKLGIAFKRVDGTTRTTTEVLRDLMDRTHAAGDPMRQLAIASDLVGDKLGVKVVNALKDGTKAFDEFTKASSGKILNDAEIGRLEDLKKATAGLGSRAKGAGATAMTMVSSLWMGDPQLQALLKKMKAERMEDLAKEQAAEEMKSVKAKALAEVMIKVDEKKREIKIASMTLEDKVLFLQGEQAKLAQGLVGTEDGSVAQAKIHLEIVEKEKEVFAAMAEQGRDQAERAKKINDDKEKAQEKHIHKLKVEKELTAEINEAASKVRESKGDLKHAKGDRSKFSLSDLADVSVGYNTTRDMRKQVMTAREIERLEKRGRFEASLGLGKDSEADFGRADKLRSGLSALTESDRLPFKSLEKSAAEQAKALNKLLEKASGEGLRIIPVMKD